MLLLADITSGACLKQFCLAILLVSLVSSFDIVMKFCRQIFGPIYILSIWLVKLVIWFSIYSVLCKIWSSGSVIWFLFIRSFGFGLMSLSQKILMYIKTNYIKSNQIYFYSVLFTQRAWRFEWKEENAHFSNKRILCVTDVTGQSLWVPKVCPPCWCG